MFSINKESFSISKFSVNSGSRRFTFFHLPPACLYNSSALATARTLGQFKILLVGLRPNLDFAILFDLNQALGFVGFICLAFFLH